jgi:hypothetical protein
MDKYEQIARWGEQKFDFGPWPGRRSYADEAGAHERLFARRDGDGKPVGYFAGPDEAQLRAADEAERRRGRAAPAPVFG